jgi:hypothetical protein
VELRLLLRLSEAGSSVSDFFTMSSAVFYFCISHPSGSLFRTASYLHHLKLNSVVIATVIAVPLSPALFPGGIRLFGRSVESAQVFDHLVQLLPDCSFVLLLWFQSYFWILFCVVIQPVHAAILPFTEAMAQEEQEMGRLDYGRTRLWERSVLFYWHFRKAAGSSRR